MKFVKKYWFLILGLVFFLFLSYFHLGADPLFDWDEGIYGQVGRELKPPVWDLTWNSEAWFEKPPLVPLLIKLGFILTADLELGARLFMPLFGTLVIIYVYLLIEKFLLSKIANYSVVFFLLAPLFLSRSRMLNTDIVLLFSTTASLYFFLILEKKIDKNKIVNWRDWLKIAFLISIGVLSKGIMGFLPFLIWGAYLVFCRRDLLSKTNIYHWIAIGGLTALLVIPWHIYMTIKYGKDFWQVYLIEQVFVRTYKPIEYHFGGWLYYVKFLIENLKWVLLISFFGGVSFLRCFLKTKNKLFWLLLVWGGLVLGLFTLAKTKLFWYILPLYPVLAILFACFGRYLRKAYWPCLVLTIVWVVLFNYPKFSQPVSPLNARNFIAESANNECKGEQMLVLVNASERRSKEILPKELQLSSSFIYGGAPSIVFYYQNKVNFFYDVDEFYNSFSHSKDGDCAMISVADYQRLGLKDRMIKKEGQWLLIRR